MDCSCGCWETPSKVLLWDMELHSPGKGRTPNFLPPREEKSHLGFSPQGGSRYWDEPSVMVCPLQTEPASLVWAVLSKVQVALGR